MLRIFKKACCGFTLIELLVLIVIVGILAAVAVPRFMGAQNRARVLAARADLNVYRQALGMFEDEYGTYPSTLSLSDQALTLVDKQQSPFVSPLPSGHNFTELTYTLKPGYDTNGLGYVPSSYEIEVTCLDNAKTTLTARPNGVYQNGKLAK